MIRHLCRLGNSLPKTIDLLKSPNSLMHMQQSPCYYSQCMFDTQRSRCLLKLSSVQRDAQRTYKYPKHVPHIHESIQAWKNDILEEPDILKTSKQWEDEIARFMEITKMPEQRITFLFMKALSVKPHMCKSLHDYLQSTGKQNVLCQITFIDTCMNQYKDQVLNELSQLLESLTGKFDGFVPLGDLTFAVGKSPLWLMNEQILDDLLSVKGISITSAPNVLQRLLQSAIINREYTEYYRLLSKYSTTVGLSNEKFINMLLSTTKTSSLETDVLLELLSQRSLSMTIDQADTLASLCDQNPMTCCSNSSISVQKKKIPRCNSCGSRLELSKFTAEQMDILKEAAMNDIVRQRNIYMTSTPAELEGFLEMMERFGPFDHVVDGLNLIIGMMPHKMNSKMKHAVKLANHLGSKNMLIVFRGRETMVRRILDNVTYLHLSHKTKDDVYILLAAFLSGPNCYVLSNDLFKNHLSRLDAVVAQQLFLDWQEQRQIQMWKGDNTPSINFKFPAGFHPQETESHWHVRVKSKDTATGTDRESRCLCIEKKSYAPSEELGRLRSIRNKLDAQSDQIL